MKIIADKLRLAISVITVVGIALLTTGTPAQADKNRDYAMPASYLLSEHGVVPMSEAIARIKDDFDGTIIKIKLDRKKHPWNWKYKSKVLLPDGRVVKIEHDARSLEIIKFKIKS